MEETSANLLIPSLGLEEEGSYSCAGVNYLGIGDFATIDMGVIGEILSSLILCKQLSSSNFLSSQSVTECVRHP